MPQLGPARPLAHPLARPSSNESSRRLRARATGGLRCEAVRGGVTHRWDDAEVPPTHTHTHIHRRAHTPSSPYAGLRSGRDFRSAAHLAGAVEGVEARVERDPNPVKLRAHKAPQHHLHHQAAPAHHQQADLEQPGGAGKRVRRNGARCSVRYKIKYIYYLNKVIVYSVPGTLTLGAHPQTSRRRA